MIPSTLRELARITELEDKVKILERDHDNAVNVVYQASLKTAAIQRLFSDVEGSSLFEDLEAIEAYARTAATTIADERERNQALVTENTRYRALMEAQNDYATDVYIPAAKPDIGDGD